MQSPRFAALISSLRLWTQSIVGIFLWQLMAKKRAIRTDENVNAPRRHTGHMREMFRYGYA